MGRKKRRARRSMRDRIYDRMATISYRRLLEATLDLAIIAFRSMYCKDCPNRLNCKHPCPEAERRFKAFHQKVVAEKIALN